MTASSDMACARLLADIHLLATYAQETALKVFEPASPLLQPAVRLSAREREVLNWVKDGKSAWVIGEILGISEHTVKVHLWRLFKRIGVNSRTQMLHYARVNGLLIN